MLDGDIEMVLNQLEEIRPFHGLKQCFLFSFLSLGMLCVWKAKTSSSGSSSTVIATESQPSHSAAEACPVDTSPGKSLRNFRFDKAAIHKASESAFPPRS